MNNSNGQGTPFEQFLQYIYKGVAKLKKWAKNLNKEEEIVFLILFFVGLFTFMKFFGNYIGLILLILFFIIFLSINRITAKIQQQTLDVINNELIPILKNLGYNNPIIEVDKYIKDDMNLFYLGLAPSYDYCYENIRILTDEFVYTSFYTTRLSERRSNDKTYYEEVEDFAGIILGVNTGHYFKSPVRIISTGENDSDIGNFKGRSKDDKEMIIDTDDAEFNRFFEVFASNIEDAQDALQFYILDALKSYAKNYNHFNVCFYKKYMFFSFNNSRDIDNYKIPDFQLACNKNGYNSNYNLNISNRLNDILYEIKLIDSIIN